MSNFCETLNIKTVKYSELDNSSLLLQPNDIILTIQKSGLTYYSRKTTFSDFARSIKYLTSSLSGNVKGNFIGDFIGSVTGGFDGNFSGNFQGIINNSTGSIKGIPFTTFNGHEISFDGTSSYAVSSSNSLFSNNSINSLSSSYALSSSNVPGIYINTPFSINSSFSKSSSFSISSSFSKACNKTFKSIDSDFSYKASSGKNAKSSDHSNYSVNSVLSKQTTISDFSISSSFTNNSLTSSFVEVAKFGLKYANANSYNMNYYTVNDLPIPLGPIGGNMPVEFRIDDPTPQNLLRKGTNNNWLLIKLDKIYGQVCGAVSGSLPQDTEYIDVFFKLDNSEQNINGYIAWCADIEDITKGKIMVDHFDSLTTDGFWERNTRIRSRILPVKPGNPPSFYIKVYGNGTGNSKTFSYNILEIYLRGYYTADKCR